MSPGEDSTSTETSRETLSQRFCSAPQLPRILREGLPLTDILQHRTALYVNDDWKPLRRLTLNLGFRWEYNSPATDVDGLWRSAEWRNGRN